MHSPKSGRAITIKRMTSSPSNFKPWDVVVVPFPYSDHPDEKVRPAVVLSSPKHIKATGVCYLAMITSAQNPSWEGDVLVTNLRATGASRALRCTPRQGHVAQHLAHCSTHRIPAESGSRKRQVDYAIVPRELTLCSFIRSTVATRVGSRRRRGTGPSSPATPLAHSGHRACGLLAEATSSPRS